MQEFALLPLLAQSAQPMLADQIVEAVRYLVLVWAVVAERAVAFAEGLAVGAGWVEAEAVFVVEEGREGEGVGGEGVGVVGGWGEGGGGVGVGGCAG